MNRIPLLRSITREKYSPSSSTESRVSQGPAASVNSRLTSQVAVCTCQCPSHFLINHSVGARSKQSEVGINFALLGRYRKEPHGEEKSVRRSFVRAACSIWRATFCGESRSSASSH